MFESIKAHMTTRNVLLAAAGVAVVGVAAYAFFKGEEVDLSDKGVQDILDSAGVVASDAVDATVNAAADAANDVVNNAA